MISDNNNVGSLINRNTSFLGFSFNTVKHCLHILFCRSLIPRLETTPSQLTLEQSNLFHLVISKSNQPLLLSV